MNLVVFKDTDLSKMILFKWSKFMNFGNFSGYEEKKPFLKIPNFSNFSKSQNLRITIFSLKSWPFQDTEKIRKVKNLKFEIKIILHPPLKSWPFQDTENHKSWEFQIHEFYPSFRFLKYEITKIMWLKIFL